MSQNFRRNFLIAWLALGAIGAAIVAVNAQDLARRDDNFIVKDFRLQNGETLPELRIHYVTLGTPVRDAAGHVKNAVLLLHGTTGRGSLVLDNFSKELFAKGQLLDAEKYYLIIPDSLGHGTSSKPSDGLRNRFPHYGYIDMVEAQHRLVTDGLGVDHLRLILGVSMGGMHTWLWSERYPSMMDAVMPVTSQPGPVTGHNWIWRRVIIEAIRNDPDWNGGLYEKQPVRWRSALPLFNMMIDSRSRVYSLAPTRAKTDELYDGIVQRWRTIDANDFLYAFESSFDYDPGQNLDKIRARLLALNFTDDLVNAVEIGVVESAVAKIPHARSVTMAPTGRSFGHFNQWHPEMWKSHLAELLNAIP